MSGIAALGRRARTRGATRWRWAVLAVLLLDACGHGGNARHASAARSSAGATSAAAGEVAPRAVDTTLIPRRSPDSTGTLGAPGYGFGVGGRY